MTVTEGDRDWSWDFPSAFSYSTHLSIKYKNPVRPFPGSEDGGRGEEMEKIVTVTLPLLLPCMCIVTGFQGQPWLSHEIVPQADGRQVHAVLACQGDWHPFRARL